MNIIREYCAVTGVYYVVVEKNKNYFQIFKLDKNSLRKSEYIFITHKNTLKSAKKLAKLLAKTYKEGFIDGSY